MKRTILIFTIFLFSFWLAGVSTTSRAFAACDATTAGTCNGCADNKTCVEHDLGGGNKSYTCDTIIGSCDATTANTCNTTTVGQTSVCPPGGGRCVCANAACSCVQGGPGSYPPCRDDVATMQFGIGIPGTEACINASSQVRGQCQAGKLLNLQRGGCFDPNDPDYIPPITDSLFLWQVNPLTVTGNSNPALNFITGVLNVWRFGTPGGFLSQLFPYLFTIAGLIMFFMFVWGGFEMIYRQDDPKVFEVGRNRATAAVIGFFLLFCSYWIAQLVEVIFGVSFLG
jgi:hypothetical protein